MEEMTECDFQGSVTKDILPSWVTHSGEASCLVVRRHETQVQSPGWEDPLEKEMATHSSILA